jgi:tetratricopeptide (TPR) repeat protein
MRQILGVLLAFVLTSTLAAQTNNSEQSEYATAAAKAQPAERNAALEQFLAAHPQSRLKLDALELLVWNSRSAGSVADLEHWTAQLLAASPDNPLAAAVIIGTSLPITSPEPPADRAKRAIGALDHFDRPEGFSHDDFAGMKNFVVSTLNGVVGYSYFEQKDFAAARPYLRKAVDLVPNNAQLTYTLALSDLQGDKPDQAEGFSLLARSVNLTRGTPAGESLAQFARQKYLDSNGTSSDWDKYLANTVVPAAPVAAQPAVVASAPAPKSSQPASATASSSTPPNAATPANTSTNTATTKISPSASTTAQPTATASSSAPTSAPSTATPSTSTAPTTAAASPPPSSSSAAPAAKPNNANVAMATPPPPPPAPEPKYSPLPPRHIPELVKGAPISVGLLIQSALAQRQTRQPIVYSLTDLVRRMRQNDEAFVMSFSKGMVFEEDLTSNDKALESAMDAIAPAPGAAIYDAVTFAAGHLNRIARNKNRVLVVISGEGDRNSGVSPLELSSELNVSGVRIYCIGLAMYSQSDQARLQQLAGYTGGQAFFINSPDQIRGALQSISNDLGIAFQ